MSSSSAYSKTQGMHFQLGFYVTNLIRFKPEDCPTWSDFQLFKTFLPLLEKLTSNVFNQRTQGDVKVEHFDVLEIIQRDLASPATSSLMEKDYTKPHRMSELWHGKLFFEHPITRKEMVTVAVDGVERQLWVGDVVGILTEGYDVPQFARISHFYRDPDNGSWKFRGPWFWRKSRTTERDLSSRTIPVVLHPNELIVDYYNVADAYASAIVAFTQVQYCTEPAQYDNSLPFFCYRRAKHQVSPTHLSPTL